MIETQQQYMQCMLRTAVVFVTAIRTVKDSVTDFAL